MVSAEDKDGVQRESIIGPCQRGRACDIEPECVVQRRDQREELQMRNAR